MTLRPERLEQPLHWKHPKRVFVNGIRVDDGNGDTLLATVIPVITAAFWSGLTTGHYAITGECSTPRRFLPCFERAAAGSRGW